MIQVRVWLGIVPWNNLSHFTKDNRLPKLILLANLILSSCSRENWECSNVLLPIAGHGNIWFSFEKRGRVQVSLCNRANPGFFKYLGEEKRKCLVACRIARVHLLHCMCSGVDVRIPFFWDVLEGGVHLAGGVLPFTSSLSPAPFPDWRDVGWRTRVIAESTACLKMSQFFTHLTKKKPLPKPEILQPAQFWHQYLNIQGRMSQFSEVENNPKFRLSEVPNILYLGTSRKLKPGSSLNCLEGGKKEYLSVVKDKKSPGVANYCRA